MYFFKFVETIIWKAELKSITRILFSFSLFHCSSRSADIKNENVEQLFMKAHNSWSSQFMKLTIHEAHNSWSSQFMKLTIHEAHNSWSSQFMKLTIHEAHKSWSSQFMKLTIHEAHNSWSSQFDFSRRASFELFSEIEVGVRWDQDPSAFHGIRGRRGSAGCSGWWTPSSGNREFDESIAGWRWVRMPNTSFITLLFLPRSFAWLSPSVDGTTPPSSSSSRRSSIVRTSPSM